MLPAESTATISTSVAVPPASESNTSRASMPALGTGKAPDLAGEAKRVNLNPVTPDDIPTLSVTLEETMAKKSDAQDLIPLEAIEGRIFVLRGHRVMLDRDLAGLYGVETRALNQAVKRNADRIQTTSCSSSPWKRRRPCWL
jgi:ORF6N domain